MNPLDFALRELEIYSRRVTGGKMKIALRAEPESFPECTDWFCDGWDIRVNAGEGEILGNNPRSVLLGVYRMFVLAGCAFLSPGAGNEVVPRIPKEDFRIVRREIPAHRHRGIVIEGAVSCEHLLGMIDWAAKNGFNSYFLQLEDSVEFFRRWYSREGNPLRRGEPVGPERAAAYVRLAEGEIARRGLVCHRVGHGWTSRILGAGSDGWTETSAEPSPEVRPLLAEIEGKRVYFGGVPINTNLCYSNREVRERFAHAVADYAVKNPQADCLHVWLADGFNNHCTCERCRTLTPTDWYVRLLNRIDEVLTAEGLNVKIVFLAYLELLQPPVSERIAHPERFILMFAPISRSYLSSWREGLAGAAEERGRLKNFPLNQFRLTTSPATQIAYLRAWKEVFPGDSLVFDYHMMWEEYKDFGQMKLARVLFEDVSALRGLGLGGMLSCQVQRAFLPSGFLMYLLGRALLGTGQTFEELAEGYFSAAYGPAGREVRAVLEELSERTPYAYTRSELPSVHAPSAEKLNALGRAVPALSERIARLTALSEGAVTERLTGLSIYLKAVEAVAPIAAKKAAGYPADELEEAYRERVRPLIFGAEERFSAEWDAFICDLIFGIIAKTHWKVLPADFREAFGEAEETL